MGLVMCTVFFRIVEGKKLGAIPDVEETEALFVILDLCGVVQIFPGSGKMLAAFGAGQRAAACWSEQRQGGCA